VILENRVGADAVERGHLRVHGIRDGLVRHGIVRSQTDIPGVGLERAELGLLVERAGGFHLLRQEQEQQERAGNNGHAVRRW
jgi:hypothetical protein